MKTKLYLLALVALVMHFSASSQVKIGDNPTTINSASLLELETTNKGLVLPRVSLTNVTSVSPLASGALTGTVIYNTNTGTTGGSGAGIYYWDGSKWNFLANTSVTSNYWSLTGNSATSPVTNFLGTTDLISIRFRTNNVQRMIIDSLGRVGIGLNNPTYALSVLSASNPLYLSGVQATSTFSSDSVLTINGGVVKKAPYSSLSNYWSLTGNSTTNSSINFLGTTDNHPLKFRVNNILSGLIDSIGGNENTFFGRGAGFKNTTGNTNTLVGIEADSLNTTGANITAVGYQAAANNTSTGLVALGYQAGYGNTSGQFNMFLGTSAGFANSTGANNAFMGYGSGFANTTGNNNAFSGYASGLGNTIGFNNTFTGSNAGSTNTTGSYNTAVGYLAGYRNITGSRNLFLGDSTASYNSTALNNASAIGFRATVGQNNSMVLGDTTNSGTVANSYPVNVGIGVRFPQKRLHIDAAKIGFPGQSDSLKIDNLAASISDYNKSILVIDSSTGFVSRQSLATFANNDYWSLTGNSGTSYATNFLGTIDNTSLRLRTNNIQRVIVDSVGNVGIGISSPIAPLHISTSSSPGIIVDRVSANNNAVAVVLRKARDLTSAAGALQTTDILGLYTAAGSYGNGLYGSSFNSGMAIRATENWTSTAQGTEVLFRNTPNGATAFNYNMGINQNGDVNIAADAGTTIPYAKLHVNSSGALSGMTAMSGDGIALTGNHFYFENPSSTSGQRVFSFANSGGVLTFNANTNDASATAPSTSLPGAIALKASNGYVGINTNNPLNQLHVSSTADPLRLGGLQAGALADSILTINNGGVVRYRLLSDITGNFWSLTGNSGTNYATNFLGTTDNISLRFRTNNIERMVIDSLGSVGIGSTNFNSNLKEKFLVDYGSTTSNNVASFTGNINDYMQIGVQNKSNGINASSDFVATADDGTDSTNYVDFGINSSNYAPSVDNFGGPHDGYLYSYSRNLIIGTQKPSSDIIFLSGGGVTRTNSVFRMDGATGNIIIGRGENNTNAAGNTLRAANGGGTNVAGGILTLQGGSGTGTAAGGALNLNGGTTGSGTAGNIVMSTAATERMRIDQAGNVGIGISNPSNKLSVLSASNPLYLSGVQATATFTTDSILTINAGIVKKAPYSSLPSGSGSGWLLTGNSGTTSSNFLGTTDAQPLIIKSLNRQLGYFDGNLYSIALGAGAINNTSDHNIAIGFNANTNNQYTLALGYSATATGVRSVAIGNGGAATVASGAESVAIGYNATASSNQTAAFGYQASASGAYALALGYTSVANSGQTTAIGYNAQATGQYGTAIGYQAIASGVQSNAIGYGAQATQQYTNAIGYNAQANGTQSTAIGYNAQTAQSNTILLGSTSTPNLYVGIGTATPTAKLHIVGGTTTNFPLQLVGLPTGVAGTDNIMTVNSTGVVGYVTPATFNNTYWNLAGNAATAGNFLGTTNSTPLQFKFNNTAAGYLDANNTSFGTSAAATAGSSNTAIGNSATASNGATAVGASAAATQASNTAIGNNATANTSSQATAIGASSQAPYQYNVAVGYNAQATVSSQETVVGSSAQAQGQNNIAIGYSAKANGSDKMTVVGSNAQGSFQNNTVVGSSALATVNSQATAIGATASAQAQNATALGYGASASGTNSAAIGTGATTSQANAIVLGTSSNSVGIGTSTPNNKLEITQGTAGNSGLRFTNLTSSSTGTTPTTNSDQTLTVNATGDVILNNGLSYVNTQTGAYTLAATDNRVIVYITSGSAVTITIPNTLPAGFSCAIIQGGAGQLTFSGTGLQNAFSQFKTPSQYASVTIQTPVAGSNVLSGQTSW